MFDGSPLYRHYTDMSTKLQNLMWSSHDLESDFEERQVELAISSVVFSDKRAESSFQDIESEGGDSKRTALCLGTFLDWKSYREHFRKLSITNSSVCVDEKSLIIKWRNLEQKATIL